MNIAERVSYVNSDWRDLVSNPAILTDDNADYRLDNYRSERWGCEHVFGFPTAELLDYGRDWGMLERNNNPFAIVVMAHLKALEVKVARRKLHLVRLLKDVAGNQGIERHLVSLVCFGD